MVCYGTSVTRMMANGRSGRRLLRQLLRHDRVHLPLRLRDGVPLRRQRWRVALHHHRGRVSTVQRRHVWVRQHLQPLHKPGLHGVLGYRHRAVRVARTVRRLQHRAQHDGQRRVLQPVQPHAARELAHLFHCGFSVHGSLRDQQLRLRRRRHLPVRRAGRRLEVRARRQ